ncbi:MAG: T9SS type A sorting domain-containing protein [Saprospiraceae bacterium]|nr:T9SS type A sorting domain-containing protein [Saprospiraceae bacterium]
MPLDYQLTLFTPTGQLVLQALVSGEHAYPLDVSDLPNGLYFVRLQIGEVPIVRRLVVQH